MNRLETIIAILVKPIQALDNAAQDVLNKRGIDSGVGFILDLIGKIIGRKRGGVSDVIYRRYLRAQVLVNRSTGRREDLIKIARAVLGVQPGTGNILVRTRKRASFALEIRDIPVDDATALVLQQMLVQATALGTRIVVAWAYHPLANTFRFDSGPGFDVGHYARGIDRTGAP